MQRAARQGDPNCISEPQQNQNTEFEQIAQRETAIGAALRKALARKAKAQQSSALRRSAVPYEC